jgi:hypothetical protein
LKSCCGLSFISGVRRNRTEFDYCGLFGTASAVVKPNPLSNTARIRKTTFKIKLFKEAMRITKIFTKFINIIVLRRNPNIVYENLIKENSTLSKIIITKIIPNKDNPSYKIAIANPEASQ